MTDNQDNGQIEVVPNPERGCGHLKHDKAYIRSDLSQMGTLPTFVELSEPIPFKEGNLRGYRRFPGIEFQKAIEHKTDFVPAPESYIEKGFENMVTAGMYESVDEIPEKEVDRLLDRLEESAVGEHVGEITAANAHDLLMWVGKTYYEEPEQFIEECKRYGLSKAIPVGKQNQPPVINPGKTRVWLIHPNGCGDGEAGIIGYSYLTRIIYTRPEDGHTPKWAQDYAKADYMDVVDIGEETDEMGDLSEF